MSKCIFKKEQTITKGRSIKIYKCFGKPFFCKEKNKKNTKYTLFGLKISKK